MRQRQKVKKKAKKKVDKKYIRVYIHRKEDIMEEATAKIFESGHSQAIRLPKEFRYDTSETDELVIRKYGDMLTLVPKDKVWENFVESTKGLADDFFTEGRDQGVQEVREKL